MPIPSEITTHVADAKRLLTSMFRDRTVIAGLLGAYVAEVQALETAIRAVILGRLLDSATYAQLDALGAIVGESRQGKTDAVYREFIRLRILINKCNGLLPEMLHIAAVAAQGNPWRYWEGYPAGFSVLFAGTVEAFQALSSALSEAKPLGVGRSMLYTPGTLDNLFRPKDCTSGTGGKGPSDSINYPYPPGYPVAHIE